MVITAQPFSDPKVVPFARGETPGPRSVDVEIAACRAEIGRLAAAVENLVERLAGSSTAQAGGLRGGHPGELRQTKKQASATLGITESRLMRFIARYHVDHPEQPKLGVQPGGNKYGRWIINTDRVIKVRDSGVPY